MYVVKLLHDFKDVGQVVYGHPRSPDAPQGKFIQSTVSSQSRVEKMVTRN
jgi:hypothetical protein